MNNIELRSQESKSQMQTDINIYRSIDSLKMSV